MKDEGIANYSATSWTEIVSEDGIYFIYVQFQAYRSAPDMYGSYIKVNDEFRSNQHLHSGQMCSVNLLISELHAGDKIEFICTERQSGYEETDRILPGSKQFPRYQIVKLANIS